MLGKLRQRDQSLFTRGYFPDQEIGTGPVLVVLPLLALVVVLLFVDILLFAVLFVVLLFIDLLVVVVTPIVTAPLIPTELSELAVPETDIRNQAAVTEDSNHAVIKNADMSDVPIRQYPAVPVFLFDMLLGISLDILEPLLELSPGDISA